jgi:uncharacterized membrane protein YphA (DoxX/SURF4 family)
VFLRLALGISFLSAVADRFGLWGAYAGERVLGKLCTICGLHGQAQLVFAEGDNPALALISTAAETLFGILLFAGLKTRITALLSGAFWPCLLCQ